MARPKTPQHWHNRVRTLSANQPSRSPATLARILAAEFEKGQYPGQPPPPGGKTVSRILAAFADVPAAERNAYRYYRWPESHESAAVPWEASRAALDFARWRMERGDEPPTNKLAVLSWRIGLAAPDAPLAVRIGLARLVDMFEEGKGWGPIEFHGFLAVHYDALPGEARRLCAVPRSLSPSSRAPVSLPALAFGSRRRSVPNRAYRVAQ